MSRRKNPQDDHWPVVMEQSSAPNAQERLARAYDLVVSAAARAQEEAPAKPTDDQKGVPDG